MAQVFNLSTALDLFGILGTIASLVGAYISFAEAKKSKTAAKAAEDARDGALRLRANLSLAQVWADGQQAQKKSLTLLQMGARPPRGVSYGKLLSDVQIYADALKQNEHLVAENDRRAYSNALKTLVSSLDILRGMTPQNAHYSTRTREAHSSLVHCCGILKKHIDFAK